MYGLQGFCRLQIVILYWLISGCLLTSVTCEVRFVSPRQALLPPLISCQEPERNYRCLTSCFLLLLLPVYSPSSSQLPRSLVGLPSCHIVLERVLNSVLSSCHPVFSSTIHPSICPSIRSSLGSSVSMPSGGGGGRGMTCVWPKVCVCLYLRARFDTVTNARLGFTGEQSRERLQMLSGPSRPPLSLISSPLFRPRRLCTLVTLTDVNINGRR